MLASRVSANIIAEASQGFQLIISLGVQLQHTLEPRGLCYAVFCAFGSVKARSCRGGADSWNPSDLLLEGFLSGL